jgi:O-methyltransferase
MLDIRQYRFHVLVPLWGPAYIAQARKFLFSSLLAPGNLSGDIPINLHIIGKESEESLVVGCPEWQPISKLCNAQFDGLDDSVFDEMSYFAMSHCYDRALGKYEAPESVFVFLTADIVIAQNTFSFLKSVLEEGYRAAVVPGPRVREEAVEHLRRADGVLVAEGRDLMRAMWEKPLALTDGYQVMENGRNKCPMHYYWRVGKYSTLARNMMMHPLMVWPDATSTRVVWPAIGANAASAALDQGYMRAAIARAESIYIGDDSDKLAVVSISSDDHFSNDIMIEDGYTLEQEKGIFSAFCNDYHFWYGAHDLFLKGEDVEPGAWGPAQAKAAAAIKTKMDFMSGVITSAPTVSDPQSTPVALTQQRSVLRRAFSQLVRALDLIGRISYVRRLYRGGIRFLLPSLGRLETSVQNLSFQVNTLAANPAHKPGTDFATSQGLADLEQKLARLEKVTNGYFERIVSLESGIQTLMRQFDARIAQLPSPATLRTTQQFLTEVFASYRWLENCDPESITCKVPLGHHSALRARYIYKEAFYVAIDYLISNQVLGPVLEFGSRSGFTSRCLGETMAERNYPDKLYLFDSFEGLPDIKSDVDLRSPEVREQKVWFKGAMAMPDDTVKLIANDMQKFMQPYQFEIVKGFFSETLPKAVPEEPVAMVHIDCDLYQSTMEVLEFLNERKLLQNGAILMFDDYNTSKADPKMGERRALADLLLSNKALSISPFLSYNWHGQAFILHVNNEQHS